ncbi:MAG: outer membrane beta-barrel protein [Verrucomicrobiota bacterium]|nr:outer membrane beta-barrel protein [Verrucomicrobiota bacterium]MDQ6939650.1 outer membrane beta-barrel protein [Verrucomicrobiota bacterium]
MPNGCQGGNYNLLRAFVAFLAFAGIVNVHAQGNASSAQDRAQLLRVQSGLREGESAPTGTDDTHAVATPNDPDLGEQEILKRQESYQPWTVSMSAPISYTSNVALSRNNEEGDALFTPGLGVSFVPKIIGTLYASFSVGKQFFFYDRFSELNFASFDARAGLTYTLPRLHNLYLRAEYDYNRLTPTDSLDEFFSNHAIDFGAEIPFPIGRAQQISAGVDLSFSVHATPAPPERHDFSAYIGYSVNLTRSLTANAIARVAVRDYVESDRTDVSGIFALGATYRFTKWLSANAIASFAINDSNQDVFDYQVGNVGGALSLTFRF